jgi:TetR/AcrR family transcriptional regulator
MTMTVAEEKQNIRRDAVATKARILKAGLAEFGAKGYGGARTDGIAKRAKCNVRMLYHYFGGKQGLYLACLEKVYIHIREEEQRLNLGALPPKEALEKLVHFTFDHMRKNSDFVHMAVAENTMRGKFVKELPKVAKAAENLVTAIQDILARGEKECQFRAGIDALQLYVSVLSLSYLHLSNRHTLSATYGQDMAQKDWLDERRDHVTEMVLVFCGAKS